MPEETPHRTRRCSWLQPVLTLAAALMARTFLTRAETCQDVVQSNARLGPMQRALVFAGLFTTCVFTGQSIALAQGVETRHPLLCWSTDFCTPVEWPHWPSIPPNAGIKNNRPEAPQLSGLNTRGIGWRLLTARFSGQLSCVGLNHRPQFAIPQTRGGCIDRPQQGIVAKRSGQFNRPQFGAMKSAVKPTALGNDWRPAKGCVRDQGRNRLAAETACRLRTQDKTS